MQVTVSQLTAKYQDVPGGLLPLLHAIQDELGHIPADTIPDIASAFSLSRAEVHGVISFYHDFRTVPGGRHRVQICRAEACQAVGGRDLEQHAQQALGIGFGETSADGSVTLEAVYCLGNCACSPSVRIDDKVHARVDAVAFDGLLQHLGQEQSQ